MAADAAAIWELIQASARGLQLGDYSAAQIEGALGTVFGVDSQLIADGTYFVVEAADGGGDVRLAGCGGWSKRRTLYGGDRHGARQDNLLDPARDHARIRAFFVAPEFARRGIGSMILDACERAAMEAGFQGFELGATVTGERLYAARGYHAMEHTAAALANGETLPIIRMVKRR